MSLLNMLMGNSEHTPKDMFKVVTYIGTGTERSITAVGFQPDLVWFKARTYVQNHYIYDVIRGPGKVVYSSLSNPEANSSLLSFDEDGFTLAAGATGENNAGTNYVAWCWKAGGASVSNTDGSITSEVSAGQVMSVVKYAGNQTAGATIGHGLTVVPKMVLIKDLTAGANWVVYSDVLGGTKFLSLDRTIAATVDVRAWNDTDATDTLITLGTVMGNNTSGSNFIAYCFADLDGVSKIGSYTGTGAVGNVVPCGFQPAYVMIKSVGTGYWWILDNKRDSHNPNQALLYANSSNVEATAAGGFDFTATGFTIHSTNSDVNAAASEYIFLAFAELPTKDSPENHNLPLFGQIAYTGDGAAEHNITGLPFKPDLIWIKARTVAHNPVAFDSLRGAGNYLTLAEAYAEGVWVNSLRSFNADGFTLGTEATVNGNTQPQIAWAWNAGGELVPNLDGSIESSVMANVDGGFSIVQYTGTGANATVGHGLPVAPKLIILKAIAGGNASTRNWMVYSSESGPNETLLLNTTRVAFTGASYWNSTAPTDSVLSVGTDDKTNGNEMDYIAYCFHSVAGMSDIGSISGTGAEQAITGLGFEPDWVMIKRTDSVDGWHIFDSRREATKYLYADATTTETTTAQTLKSFDSDGFTLGTDAGVNASGGDYIYMAFKAGDNPDTLHQTETGDLQISSESGSIVDDNGTHTITNTGVTVGSTDPACGTYDMVFDGIAGTDLIIPHSTDFVFGADFTIDFWATPEEIYPQEIISKRADSTSEGVAIAIIGSAWHWYAAGVNWGLGNTITPVVIDTPVHVALLRFGSYWLTYINGVQQSSLFSAGSITDNGADLSVGLNHVGFGTYKGKLDQVRTTKGTALWTTTNFNLTDKGLFYPSGTLNV